MVWEELKALGVPRGLAAWIAAKLYKDLTGCDDVIAALGRRSNGG